MRTRIVVLVLALALGFVSYAIADESAALGKVSAAAAAAKDKKGAEVKAALDAVATMIADDTAAAGPVAKVIGNRERTTYDDRAKLAGGGVMPGEIAFTVMTDNVKDIYGLLIPAGKGDFAAAAEYVKKLAGDATGDAKTRLQAAAEALGGGDKAKGFAMARVTVFASANIIKADSLVNADKAEEAALLINRVGTYLGGEAALAKDAGRTDAADTLTENAGLMRSSAGDITKGRPVGDLSGQIGEIETAVTGVASAEVAPAKKETAPKAGEAKKAPAERKKSRKNPAKTGEGEK